MPVAWTMSRIPSHSPCAASDFAALERPQPATWAALATAAIGLPMLLAFNLPPSSTFLNQAAALIGWGA